MFLSPEGQRWGDRNLRRAFYRCLEKAGIREVRFHDLRQTHASLMAEAGTPSKYVQEQFEYSSIQVTMEIYSYLFPGGNREWVARLDHAKVGEAREANSVAQEQPIGVASEQPSDKLWE